MTISSSELLTGRIPRQRVIRTANDPKALIGEARQRQRRRRLSGTLAALAVIAAAGALYPALTGGASVKSGANGVARPVSGPSTAAGNPCAFLTTGQVAAVLGGRVASRALSHTGAVRLCTWAGPTSHGPFGVPVQPQLYVSVLEEPLSRFDRSAKAEFEVSAPADGGSYSVPGGFTPVRGLGTRAFYYSRGDGMLRVWQRGYAIDLQPAIAVASLSTLRGLATSALKHL